MNLSGANILIAAQYAAPYEGNFIASLRALKNKLCSEFNARCAFVFPKSMERQQWAEHFINENIVFLTGDSFQPITKSEATEIVSTFQPDLIYTHFEGYDSMMARAAFRSPKTTRIVWHMHDTLGFQKHPLKALYQFYCFVKHYGIPFAAAGITKQQGGVKPCIIGVCKHEPDFVRKFRLCIPTNEIIIPNGINISRISRAACQSHKIFTFLAFAGRNVQKRVDILLMAADNLIKKGIQLNVVLVDNHTPTVADTMFNHKPDWLTEIKPQENINSVFSLADCFVSTSVHETFSYAIAEASIFGIPVIQSDIEGTMWNANNPSTFLFKSENVEDLENTMLKVMQMPLNELHAKCLISSQNNIRDYSIESWADKTIGFFKSIP